MDNTLVLHTGRDRLEQEYAEYMKNMVGAGDCTGLGELSDISRYEKIVFVFLFKDEKLPEAVEDIFFERAGELAGRKIELIGIGPSSEHFADEVKELTGMCGVAAESRFLRESAHVYTEQTGGDDRRLLFVRELVFEEPEKEAVPEKPAEKIPEEPAKALPVMPAEPLKEEAEAEAAEPGVPEKIVPEEAPAIPERQADDMAAEPEEELPPEDAEDSESRSEGTPETFMDEFALAEAVRAVMAESEETVTQVTDEVSAEFPDEEDAENEEPSEESEQRNDRASDEESREDGGEILRESGRAAAEEAPRQDGGPVGDGLDDACDDWNPGKGSGDDRKGGEIRLEEPQKEREAVEAGEVLPEEKAEKEPAVDRVGAVSWELTSGETLKKYIRRANGEEPWPAEETPAIQEEKEPAGRSYRFVDEPVTVADEPAYEPPLGLKDLEAMEAEEAAEAVNRRERRKEREEREDDPGDNIIARAAARILAFFRGTREDDEALDFGDDESGREEGKERSFLQKIRDEVGVYDDEEEIPEVAAEPVGDYHEDDSEEFEDDADFSDSFGDDEDEEDF